MAEILDIIDEKGDPKDALQAIRDNFISVNKQSLRAGEYLLASASFATTQAFTSATWAQITNCQFSITASGGLLKVFASFPSSVADKNRAGYIKIELDDVIVAAGQMGNHFVGDAGNGSQEGQIALAYLANVNAGKHTIKCYARLDSGGSTFTIGNTSLLSTVFITESLRG